jgi:pyruvate formate-lyase activating enzyme-like uncharacterized protein
MKRIEVRYKGHHNQDAVEFLAEAGIDVVRLRPLIVDTDSKQSNLDTVLAAARMLTDVTGVLIYPHRDVSAAADLVAIDN